MEGLFVKYLVIYYSETGNTQKIATAVAMGLGIQAMKIDEIKPLALSDYDLICFGTPVQGASPAKKLLDFISQMPVMDGKKTAVFCTMHMFGAKNAIQILKKTLEAKGMVFLGGFSARGWSRLVANFGPRIFNRGRPNHDELLRAEEFGRNLLAKMQQPQIASTS
jgi:flavodoxin